MQSIKRTVSQHLSTVAMPVILARGKSRWEDQKSKASWATLLDSDLRKATDKLSSTICCNLMRASVV